MRQPITTPSGLSVTSFAASAPKDPSLMVETTTGALRVRHARFGFGDHVLIVTHKGISLWKRGFFASNHAVRAIDFADVTVVTGWARRLVITTHSGASFAWGRGLPHGELSWVRDQILSRLAAH